MKMEINKPIVKRQNRGMNLIRNDRGFSKSELKESGVINIKMAKNKGIPVDLLRKTKNPENVERLRPIVKDILKKRKKVD